MDEYDDYPVAPFTDNELEDLVDSMRAKLRIVDNDVPTASDILSRLARGFGVEIVVRPDCEMGRKEAYTTTNPSRIFFRASVYRAVQEDTPRARMTVAHELIHFFLHPGAPKARATDGGATPDFIKPCESAERQARFGAAAFWMPRHIVAEVRSAAELQRRCRVSAQAAEIRLEKWRKTRGRPELSFVRDHINHLKSLTPQRHEVAKSNKQHQARKLWEKLEHIEGEDPDIYRLCSHGIYRVAWSEFEKMTQCGWFIRDNKVVASIALERG
jgi:hypothetical protein